MNSIVNPLLIHFVINTVHGTEAELGLVNVFLFVSLKVLIFVVVLTLVHSYVASRCITLSFVVVVIYCLLVCKIGIKTMV